MNKIIDYITKLANNNISFKEIASFLPKFYSDIEIISFSKNNIRIKQKGNSNVTVLIDNKPF